MYKVLETIGEALGEHNIKYGVNTKDNMQALLVAVNGKSAPRVNVAIMASADINDATFRAPNCAKFEEDKREVALDVLNRFNQKYRFIKFVLEDSNTVTAIADLPMKATNTGAVGYELFIRLVSVVDAAYADLMRAVWG